MISRKNILLSVVLFSVLTLTSWGIAQAACPTSGSYESVGGVCIPTGTGLPDTPMADIIMGLLMWLLGIFGFLGIISFIISGIFYLTAAGSAEQEKTAKKAMQMSIMGIVVGLAGYVVIMAIDAALNARYGF